MDDIQYFLSDVRVLDFTGELGPYAGKLYAGLGADVIHIESPAGDPLRNVGPFYQGIPGRERSLQYLYYNTGKRGMVLDLSQEKGREVFVELCKTADVLLESFAPAYLQSLGLSYDVLSAANPRLVHTSITPFGQFGPYAGRPGSDLVCSALGGYLFLAGIDNDKPVRAPDDQAYRMAEVFAAVGSISALLFARKNGRGQFVDVACVEAVGMALENAAQYWDLEGKNRRGRGREGGSATIHPCRDGYIAIVAIMGTNKIMWDPFVQWMKAEGVAEWEVFDDEKWVQPSYRSSRDGYETFCRIFERYTMKHDKRTLYESGQAHRVAVSPVSDGKDLLENPQLDYRGFWQKIVHPHLGGEVVYPGAPYEFSGSGWKLGSPAPVFGEHTAEILLGIGYGQKDIADLVKKEIVHVA